MQSKLEMLEGQYADLLTSDCHVTDALCVQCPLCSVTWYSIDADEKPFLQSLLHSAHSPNWYSRQTIRLFYLHITCQKTEFILEMLKSSFPSPTANVQRVTINDSVCPNRVKVHHFLVSRNVLELVCPKVWVFHAMYGERGLLVS